MKYFLLFLLIPSFSFAQLAPGDQITFGEGTARKGSFKFVLDKRLRKAEGITNKQAFVIELDKYLTGNHWGKKWFKVKQGEDIYFVYAAGAIAAEELKKINDQSAKSGVVKKMEADSNAPLSVNNIKGIVNAVGDGTVLRLGRGSQPNGNFAYICISKGNWLLITSTDNTNEPVALNANYAGLEVTVKKTKLFGNRKMGYKKLAIVGTGNIVNYQVDLYGAIQSGEIIAINDHPIVKEGEETAKATGPAERLIKWKKALEMGAINQYEYDSIKAEILH